MQCGGWVCAPWAPRFSRTASPCEKSCGQPPYLISFPSAKGRTKALMLWGEADLKTLIISPSWLGFCLSFDFSKVLLHGYFGTTAVLWSLLLLLCRSLSVVNICPKGRGSTQAVPDTRQMLELERLLGESGCLPTLCKTAPCLHFSPFIPHPAHLWVLPRWSPLW